MSTDSLNLYVFPVLAWTNTNILVDARIPRL
jgi:hypothetical protein